MEHIKNILKIKPVELKKNKIFGIMNSTTTCDKKVLTAIDYLTYLLVKKTCEDLQSINDKCIDPFLKETPNFNPSQNITTFHVHSHFILVMNYKEWS